MATASSSNLGPAPWRKLFLEHIQTMPSPEFSLGTVRKTASATGVVYSPRARTCVFRGLLAELPVNPKNEAELNPDVYGSDLLTLTTDCRMDKTAELFGAEEASGDDRLKGSGGGAPVEAVFWAKEPSTQWRVRGRAYVLAPDVEESPEGKEVMATLTSRMRGKGSGQWSFAREITAHFGNLSPRMRGTFRNPPPGTPVARPVEDSRLGLGQKVTDLRDEVVRGNFRLVVVVPEELDRCDLSDPERGRRWLYTYVGGGRSGPTTDGASVQDGWEEVEVWP